MGRITIKSEIYADLPKPSILLYNITKDTIIFNTNANLQRPLSSLTKLMTAVVAMDFSNDVDTVLPLSTLRTADVIPESKYSKADLLKALLVCSDNSAAETLAENYPGGRDQFLIAMNSTAQALGMKNTYFLDPHGHDSKSQSSAADLLLLIKYALEKHTIISNISVLKTVKFNVDHTTISDENINITLLNEFDGIILNKTGRSSRSGYCYTIALNYNDCVYALIMLGSPRHDIKEAYTRKLIHNYITQPLQQTK
jgi:serine-type D-Ala-D-Ala endopeptidase (penicillin-binding protein 7)